MTISEGCIKYKYHGSGIFVVLQYLVEVAVKKLNGTSFIGHILTVTKTKQIKSPTHKSSPVKTEAPTPESNENRSSNIKKTNWEMITEIANNGSNKSE